MRIRGLKPDFFKDEDLATLPFEARMLFQGLWCIADREGRLEDRPKYIQAEIFPYDKKINIENLLNLLCFPQLENRPEKVFIRRYQVNRRKYIDIPEFLTHQNPHHTEKKSIIPEFNRELTVIHPSIDGESQEDTVHGSLFIDTVHGECEGKKLEENNGEPRRPHSNGFKKQATDILTFLNEKVKRNYQPVEVNIDFIIHRLQEGATQKQCRQVIVRKARDWLNDEKMNQYLRPATLFNKTKFAQYVGELVSVPEEEPA